MLYDDTAYVTRQLKVECCRPMPRQQLILREEREMEAPPLIEDLELKCCPQCNEIVLIEKDIAICPECSKSNLALIEMMEADNG